MIDILNLDEKLKNKVIDLVEKDKVKILSLANKCQKGNFNCLNAKNDLVKLAVVIKCLNHIKAQYEKLGIPDEIFYATMDDIRIWCENDSNKGLKNINWIKNHINCELFKIGRLQFQLHTCKNPTLKYKLLPFNYGEKVIYIHIPQGEKLIYSDCINSIKSAKVFFAKYFPHYKYRFFFCESWLLYGENWQFMEPGSNIMQFNSMFDVVYSVNYDCQAIEKIFGKRQFNKSHYAEKTSLQRNAKQYLMEGGKLGFGVGVIHFDDI